MVAWHLSLHWGVWRCRCDLCSVYLLRNGILLISPCIKCNTDPFFCSYLLSRNHGEFTIRLACILRKYWGIQHDLTMPLSTSQERCRPYPQKYRTKLTNGRPQWLVPWYRKYSTQSDRAWSQNTWSIIVCNIANSSLIAIRNQGIHASWTFWSRLLLSSPSFPSPCTYTWYFPSMPSVKYIPT